MSNLIKVGFWRASLYSNEPLPFPTEMCVDSWQGQQKDLVVSYIKDTPISDSYFGYSKCRICDEQLGASDKSDGVFIFPEKYEHYLIKHNIKPPQEFINHIFKKLAELMVQPTKKGVFYK